MDVAILACLSWLTMTAFKDYHLLKLYQVSVRCFQMQTCVSSHLGLDMIIIVLYLYPLTNSYNNRLG